MPRPVQPGAFDLDLAALATMRRRLVSTPQGSPKRRATAAEAIGKLDELHDLVRKLVDAPVEKRV